LEQAASPEVWNNVSHADAAKPDFNMGSDTLGEEVRLIVFVKKLLAGDDIIRSIVMHN
jgi:hypothetical protein